MINPSIKVCTLLAASFAFLILGRVRTFHLTEGEAFLFGWRYWLATLICVGAALWFAHRPGNGS